MVKLLVGNFNTDERVLIVAEIGNNHEGSLKRAVKMIKLAAEAGADAVKFQTFRTEHYVSPINENRFNQLKSFEFESKELEKLKLAADRAGVIFISTPFDIGSAVTLNKFVSAFKIASGDNTFYPMIEAVARFGKPILLSCGLSGLSEIGYAKSLIERIWAANHIDPGLALLHCVSCYPVPQCQINLSVIHTLSKKYRCTVGFSDHTLGIKAAELSVAAGARIIEKHFTLDKNYSDFRDHQLSADPEELKRLVTRVREAEKILGSGEKKMQICESDVETLVRRSIAASRYLMSGDIIRVEDITWVRPSGGIPPGKEELVLGKTLTRDLRPGQMFTLEILE